MILGIVVVGLILGIVLFVTWIGSAVLIGRYTQRHGKGFWWYFGLSLLVSPFVGFSVARTQVRLTEGPDASTTAGR